VSSAPSHFGEIGDTLPYGRSHEEVLDSPDLLRRGCWLGSFCHISGDNFLLEGDQGGSFVDVGHAARLHEAVVVEVVVVLDGDLAEEFGGLLQVEKRSGLAARMNALVLELLDFGGDFGGERYEMFTTHVATVYNHQPKSTEYFKYHQRVT
jgi:hypothetical protein